MDATQMERVHERLEEIKQNGLDSIPELDTKSDRSDVRRVAACLDNSVLSTYPDVREDGLIAFMQWMRRQCPSHGHTAQAAENLSYRDVEDFVMRRESVYVRNHWIDPLRCSPY